MANDAPDETPARWKWPLGPERAKPIAALALIAAPVLALGLIENRALLASVGLSLAAASLFWAQRLSWRPTAWASVVGAAAWAIAALGAGWAQQAPAPFSGAALFAGALGLAHARLGGFAPGAAMALTAVAALLILGAGDTLIAPAGAAFGALVILAAVLGAASLRTEGMHATAFAAAGAGLFVLSGQPEAAIWFTPVAAWTGALFLAIAAVRAPVLGARGTLIAGTGAAAPILAAGALYAAQHGLAEPLAAAGAFACLALIFAGLLVFSARRRARGIAELKLTAWVLLAAALISAAFAVGLTAPRVLVGSAMAAFALGFVALDRRNPKALWRGAAIASALGALWAAGAATEFNWPRADAAFFEGLAIAFAMFAVTAAIRLGFSLGAPNTTPLGFVEAGTHAAALLAAALALATLANAGARAIRRSGAALLAAGGTCAVAVSALLWLTPLWAERAVAGTEWPLMRYAPLGFALPAIAAWAHWFYWRMRGAHARTRAAFAIATLTSAACAALQMFGARAGVAVAGAADWTGIALALMAFGLAIGLNFAPGVTSEPMRRSYLQENFHRHRRGQQSR
jgi:hypothetical protein